jgi:hypothetical protein
VGGGGSHDALVREQASVDERLNRTKIVEDITKVAVRCEAVAGHPCNPHSALSSTVQQWVNKTFNESPVIILGRQFYAGMFRETIKANATRDSCVPCSSLTFLPDIPFLCSWDLKPFRSSEFLGRGRCGFFL